MSLTRGERFKDARTVHNQHGKQTMSEVSEATKINKSIIQALEDDSSDRSVGYDKVIKLASHYNVTADYLLGLSDDPSRTPAATDDLHLSAKAINELRSFTCSGYYSDDLSLLMENLTFWSIIREIIAFRNASIAEGIYDSIQFKYYVSDESNCIEEMEAESKMELELSAVINDDSIHESIRRCLSSIRYLKNIPVVDGEYSDAAYVTNFLPSEIHEQRSNAYLLSLLEQLDPSNLAHDLRRVYMEAAHAGHITYDHSGNAHYSSRKQSGDNNGND